MLVILAMRERNVVDRNDSHACYGTATPITALATLRCDLIQHPHIMHAIYHYRGDPSFLSLRA